MVRSDIYAITSSQRNSKLLRIYQIWHFLDVHNPAYVCFLTMSTNQNQMKNGLFQKKSKHQGYNFLKKPLEFFIFLLYPWKFQTKQSSAHGYSTKLCQIPWKFQGQKQKPLEIPHYFFLVTLGNSTLFLINPWKFHMLFL